jgi:hypothetical protein
MQLFVKVLFLSTEGLGPDWYSNERMSEVELIQEFGSAAVLAITLSSL